MRAFTHAAAICLAFLRTASASPVAQGETGIATLEKRDDFPDQILYAVNCFDLACWGAADRDCTPSVSFLAWYKNWRNSQNNEQPDSLSREYKDWSDPRNNHNNGRGFPLYWEGVEYNLDFDDSHSKVKIKIEPWGHNAGTGNDAGHASNSFNTNFNCKRDNDRSLFERWTGSNLYHCQSLYYCPKA